jgi:hypothetical protein
MTMATKHEQYAARLGYKLVQIQGRTEWWQTKDGKPMLYNRDTRKWMKAYCVPV